MTDSRNRRKNDNNAYNRYGSKRNEHKRLRINAGLSVKDLADIFGFATPQAVYKWQHGVAMPTLDNLVVLAAVFGVSMDEIIAVDVNVKAQISA